MDFSPEALNARHDEIQVKREKILAKATPLREARDAAVDDLTPKQRREADEAIIKAEKGLYELDVERAVIVRALGTRTGVE